MGDFRSGAEHRPQTSRFYGAESAGNRDTGALWGRVVLPYMVDYKTPRNAVSVASRGSGG